MQLSRICYTKFATSDEWVGKAGPCDHGPGGPGSSCCIEERSRLKIRLTMTGLLELLAFCLLGVVLMKWLLPALGVPT
jgi:hypothetical protein